MTALTGVLVVRKRIAVVLAAVVVLLALAVPAQAVPTHRVNAGGPQLTSTTPPWSADTTLAPSSLVNATQTKNRTTSTSAPVSTSDPSVPAGTPASVFQTQRWDPIGNQELQWNFPATLGEQFEVRLYFAEIYTPLAVVGGRQFDVVLDGQTVLNDFDIFATAGAANRGITRAFTVTSDGNIDLDFLHVTDNPVIAGIEIEPVAAPPPGESLLAPSAPALAFGEIATGTTAQQTIQLTNDAPPAGDDIVLDSTTITGADADVFSDAFDDAGSVTLAPGESTNLVVTFAPPSAGAKSALLAINHDGGNDPLEIALSGSAAAEQPPAGAGIRVNAGGIGLVGPPTWDPDTVAAPSPLVNAEATTNRVSSSAGPISLAHPSIPAGTSPTLFQTQRWDPIGRAEMQWSIPAAAGPATVRLYFVESYAPAQVVGGRVFDVTIEGALVLDDYDIFAEAGANAGVVKSFDIVSDGTVNVGFLHGVENPSIAAIEVIPSATQPTASVLQSSTPSIGFGSILAGATASQSVTLTNSSGAGNPPIVIDSTTISGGNAAEFSDDFNDAGNVTLNPGESTTISATFAPTSVGAKSAVLTVAHDGVGGSLTIPLSGTATSDDPPPAGTDTRVNAGGPAITGPPAWSADASNASPSPFLTSPAANHRVTATGTAIDMSHPSIPAGTPPSVFQSERYDPTGAAEMAWSIPAPAGPATVRLYFADTYAGTQVPGARQFDVTIEGQQVLDNYEIFAEAGANAGVVKTFNTTSDGTIDILFGHVIENPTVSGIEVISQAAQANELTLVASPPSLAFGNVNLGAVKALPITLEAVGPASAPPINVTETTLSGGDAGSFGDQFDDGGSVALEAGEELVINANFSPLTAGTKSATLAIENSGSTPLVNVPLNGTGIDPSQPSQIGFSRSTLQGEISNQPTALAWGPDGRLYVTHFRGEIIVYTVAREGKDQYVATAAETIYLVRNIPNHNDDGTPATVSNRLSTGIWVGGTAASPVIYASSSDPRIGLPNQPDTNLDTNSSMVSRLTRSGGTWTKQDLVRGLPRSEENHSANGLFVDESTNTLYQTISGNTNAGAPSGAFGDLPEYAMGTGILKIDLDAIGSGTYDLPTLDDDSVPGPDVNDPFSGNDGKNMARYVPGGPVDFLATGLRNAYDVIRASNGSIYTIDNGGNAGWGGPPAGEGPGGTCTNDPPPTAGVTVPDKLYRVEDGDYFGHPNPTRGNMANTFNTPPQSPVDAARPQECDFLEPHEAGALTTFGDSANGFAEYTSSNFGGAMQGDFVVPLYNDNRIGHVDMNAAGTAALSNTTLLNSVGTRPLDIVTADDDHPMRGTLFVADISGSTIVVYEPNDFDGGVSTCTGAYDPGIDEDGDGYSNADEIDNGTNPCSEGDRPADADLDGISDLNDPNDDNDELPDLVDPFAIDPDNGKQNDLPVVLSWNNDDPAGGILGLNFTGLMTNGTSDWRTQYDGSKMTAGGAAGKVTVDDAPQGDALGALNTQQYAFQVGVNAPSTGSTPFTAETQVVQPWASLTPAGNQSLGMYIGTGDQDNYIKVVATAGDGTPGIAIVREVDGVPTTQLAPMTVTGHGSIHLYLTVTPSTGEVQASYKTVSPENVAGPRTNVGSPVNIPSSWLTASDRGLAAGIISTAGGAPGPFPVTWEFLQVVSGPGDA